MNEVSRRDVLRLGALAAAVPPTTALASFTGAPPAGATPAFATTAAPAAAGAATPIPPSWTRPAPCG
jgi:hypothetical protein